MSGFVGTYHIQALCCPVQDTSSLPCSVSSALHSCPSVRNEIPANIHVHIFFSEYSFLLPLSICLLEEWQVRWQLKCDLPRTIKLFTAEIVVLDPVKACESLNSLLAAVSLSLSVCMYVCVSHRFPLGIFLLCTNPSSISSC